MDIQVDIRGFLEIHAWIFYGFSDQGWLAAHSRVRPAAFHVKNE